MRWENVTINAFSPVCIIAVFSPALLRPCMLETADPIQDKPIPAVGGRGLENLSQ